MCLAIVGGSNLPWRQQQKEQALSYRAPYIMAFRPHPPPKNPKYGESQLFHSSN